LEISKYGIKTALYPWCKNNTNLSIGVASSLVNTGIRNVIDLYGPTTNTMQLHLKSSFAIYKLLVIGKGKSITLQDWTGPEGSRRLRLPDFKTIGT
jgi:hypothetical protein